MAPERSAATRRPPQHVLDSYTRPAAMTSGERHQATLDAVSGDVAALARTVQGLLLHEHWAAEYGVSLSDERRDGSHVRPVARTIERLLASDPRPLDATRAPAQREVGVCRHFTVLLVALLRTRGVPARARCGFGSYFAPGSFEDHWVGEYWHDVDSRWILVDAQLDEVQRTTLRIGFDPLDVPRDRFVVAADAWQSCRSGAADPAKFGIFDLRGLWFVAGNVLRDAAALCNMEMLPWDVWGAMATPGTPLEAEQTALFDRLAELIAVPDAGFDELRALYDRDDRVRVPPTVFNALLGRVESV